EFVAVLDLPEVVTSWNWDDRVRIPETGSENFGTITCNRPLRRKCAVFTHAHNLAGVTVSLGDTFGHIVIRYRHVQHAVMSKVDARGQVSFRFAPCFGNENIPNVG